ILNAIFYKPLTKALDDRDDYIRTNKVEARERLDKAERLTKQYAAQLAEARRQSQATVVAAENEAQKMAAQKIAEAQKEAQVQREQAAQDIEQQKQEALRSLEQQVDALSQQIVEKLLGPQPVK
ncbi:MAG: F0F1 ATP synthase subunit B', partial [Chroococcidiopsidaceae cyanobacterium CP_BM_RX_35]|nr:F0F1 ATP synthase subunit B' [Chroococcidiopsidaceae cyanobacterium CP_BM_RX_35]